MDTQWDRWHQQNLPEQEHGKILEAPPLNAVHHTCSTWWSFLPIEEPCVPCWQPSQPPWLPDLGLIYEQPFELGQQPSQPPGLPDLGLIYEQQFQLGQQPSLPPWLPDLGLIYDQLYKPCWQHTPSP